MFAYLGRCIPEKQIGVVGFVHREEPGVRGDAKIIWDALNFGEVFGMIDLPGLQKWG